MSGRPGDGCDDPRDPHLHWCGFCGTELLFTVAKCRFLKLVPPCPRCSSTDWRNEIDKLIAPNYCEDP